MSKRVLGNISNAEHIHCKHANVKAAKRGPQTAISPVKTVANKKLKHREFNGEHKDLTNDENSCEPSDSALTRSIELKVKAIDIGSKCSATLTLADTPKSSEKAKRMASRANVRFDDPSTYYWPPKAIPSAMEDFDRTQLKCIESEPHYAFDVFEYYKQKERALVVKKYIDSQPEISKAMRQILVDWMVEVQESFELNHETLYLAVKLVDHFLMREKISKTQFQLVGATALLISAKFDERIPPAIEDFLYICDDAYNRRDIILMEIKILYALDFYLGFPLSYRFLRRFARCAKLPMEVLTLARYILEMSLMEYELIEQKDSLMAASALLLALKMKGSGEWTNTLKFYSGYNEESLLPIMHQLNDVISTPSKTKTIKTKYSHKIFYEVAKISPLPKVNQ